MSFPDWLRRLPWSIVGLSAGLMTIGCLGIARAEQLAETNGEFLTRQLVWSGLALAAMLLASVPNYRRLCGGSYLLYGGALVMLGVVLLTPPINGAHRWLRLGSVGLQPAEFAKLAFVLALARHAMHDASQRTLTGLLIPLGVTLAPMWLILREPDLGTALVFLPVMFLMMVAAGARRRDLLLLTLAGLACVPALWTQMSREQKSRVSALFHPPQPGATSNDDNYQLRQSHLIRALGNGWGSWWTGNEAEDRTLYHLPEAHTDMILSVLFERWGYPAALVVWLLYLALAWRGLAIARETREPFGRLVATGVVSLLLAQVAINTAMNVGLAPITGLPLPLISYGGSGLLAHALGLGLLLNLGLRPGYEVTKEPFRYRWGTT